MRRKLITFLCLFATYSVHHSVCEASEGLQPAVTRFNKAYQTLLSADDARDSGRLVEGVRAYREALDTYTILSQVYPDWKPGVISFRIAYCRNQLEALLRKMEAANIRSAADSQTRYEAAPKSRSMVPGSTPTADSKSTVDIGKLLDSAVLLIEYEETEKARALLFKGFRADPSNNDLRLLMGITQCQAGKFEDALYLLAPLADEIPFSANVHVALGAAYFGLSRTDEAEKELRQALVLKPGLSEAYYNMSKVALSKEPPDTTAARMYYKQSLSFKGPTDEQLETILGLKPPSK